MVPHAIFFRFGNDKFFFAYGKVKGKNAIVECLDYQIYVTELK